MTVIETFGREEFLTERWRYQPGEHVTILGPTGSGKTFLAYQLLGYSASPRLPAVILAAKPRDKTTEKWTKTLGFKRIPVWPPLPSFRRPPGWTLWPRHTLTDPDGDDQRLHWNFRRAMLDCYKRGDRIVFADEVLALQDLELTRLLTTLWTRGRSMGCALWAGSQRPSHIGSYAYGMAEHLFMAHDPDKRARDRYDEIGGVDSGVVKDVVLGLTRHQFAYIRRDGGVLCIVDK